MDFKKHLSSPLKSGWANFGLHGVVILYRLSKSCSEIIFKNLLFQAAQKNSQNFHEHDDNCKKN